MHAYHNSLSVYCHDSPKQFLLNIWCTLTDNVLKTLTVKKYESIFRGAGEGGAWGMRPSCLFFREQEGQKCPSLTVFILY